MRYLGSLLFIPLKEKTLEGKKMNKLQVSDKSKPLGLKDLLTPSGINMSHKRNHPCLVIRMLI